LKGALDDLKVFTAPEVLEGYETLDDAGIFRLTDEIALVQTLDFFPPIVDDAYAFGQIATANSLSDVYAMGGRPVTAMNILAVPMDEVGPGRLHELLQGSADKLKEAECSLVGGHTVRDKELKFGCSITGLVHPKKFWSNATATPGDVLVLTKPLGSGILTNAFKGGRLSDDTARRVIECMATLNRAGCEAAVQVGGVSAATDITGFGLAGHVGNMGRAANVTMRIDTAKLPRFDEALHFAKQGVKTGGGKTNREYVGGHYSVAPSVAPEMEELVFDPQTSGGLLLAVRPDRIDPLVAELKRRATLASAVVGEVAKREGENYITFQ
jgi:selenide,water dikinase